MRLAPKWVFRSSGAYRRFTQSLETTRADIEAKKREEPSPSWIPEAEWLLTTVEERLEGGDLDGAWHCLNAASRLQIPDLRDPELWDREQMLRYEAEKITTKWRRDAIGKLLDGDPQTPAPEHRAQRLYDAIGLLHDYFDTTYYKTRILRDHLGNLLVISVVALVVFLALLGLAGTPLSSWPAWDWKTLLAVLLFGVLGASFSATRKVSGESALSKIPEMWASGSITIARTILGAVPALAVYALLRSGLVQIATADTVKLLAFAFVAGFSERFVLKVLGSFEAGAEEKPSPGGGGTRPPGSAGTTGAPAG